MKRINCVNLKCYENDIEVLSIDKCVLIKNDNEFRKSWFVETNENIILKLDHSNYKTLHECFNVKSLKFIGINGIEYSGNAILTDNYLFHGKGELFEIKL